MGEGKLLNIADADCNTLEISAERATTCEHKMQQQIEWRRAKVMESLSKGESNQREMARILHVDKSIVCRDIAYIRQ